MGSLLWYVHDHGVGHLHRARAVLDHLDVPVVVASSLPEQAQACFDASVTWRTLRPDRAEDALQGPGPLHHAPAARAARERCADLLDVVEHHDCTSAVVDVSAETVLLCRLAGLRVVAVRQSGERTDEGHHLAHECADVVWVPQHRCLEPGIDDLDRVSCTGGFSRYDGRTVARDASRRRLGLDGDRTLAVVIVGAGGSTFPEQRWRSEPAPPHVDVIIAGLAQRWDQGSVRSVGVVGDLFDLLCAADAVVTAGGWGSVHDAASAGVRAAVVAEPRPYDEQRVRVDALRRAGLVVALDEWPGPSELPEVLASTDALAPQRWSPWYDHAGAQRAAALIEAVHRG